MTYCFVCRKCGARYEGQTPGTAGELDLPCAECGGQLRRDWKAEGVGLGNLTELRKDRERGTDGLSGRKAYRDLFLPTAEDFAGRDPKDPDGTKAVREWCERHGPRPSNKKPLYPDVERKAF